MLQAINDRIDERLQALGLNASDASRRAGLHPDAIRNIRRAVEEGRAGRVGVSTRTLAALAPILGTTCAWLMEGTDQAVAGVTPFVEWDQAGAYADVRTPIAGNGGPFGDLVGHWPAGAFATRVADEAMNRLSPAGSYIIVDRNDRLLIDGRCYLGLLDGQVIFRRWAAAPDRAEPFSSDPAFRTEFLSPKRGWVIIGRVRRTLLDL